MFSISSGSRTASNGMGCKLTTNWLSSDDLGSHAQESSSKKLSPQPTFPSGVNLLPIEASGGLFAGPNQRNNNSPKRANKAPGQDYGMEMATSEKFTYSQPNRLKSEEQQKIHHNLAKRISFGLCCLLFAQCKTH